MSAPANRRDFFKSTAGSLGASALLGTAVAQEVQKKASRPQDEALADVVDLLPEQLGEPQVRQRLRKLTAQLDELLFEDEAGELAVDRDTLTRVARDRDLIPPKLGDRIVRETEKHLGAKLKMRGRGRRVLWRGAAGPKIPIRPESIETLRKLGIDRSTSVEDARRILRKQYPDIPAFWLEADAAKIRETVMQALAHNQTVWDCAVRHLGYWAAIQVFAAVGGLLIVGTATGPWGVPLAIWLIGVVGGSTAVLLLNCMANPNW